MSIRNNIAQPDDTNTASGDPLQSGQIDANSTPGARSGVADTPEDAGNEIPYFSL